MSDSSRRIRFALIGCGRMGRQHSERLREDGRGEVVALLDSQPSAANSLRAEFWPQATIAANLDSLTAMNGIDAAIICTPTAEHHSQAMACLQRNWSLMCEKPLASDRAQIVDLIAKADSSRHRGVAFSLGYQRRFASLYRTLRREVLSGRWGAVRAIASHNVENWQPTIGGTWRDDPEQNPGGFITDAGSHKIDAAFYVSNLKPVEVFARSQKWNSRVEIVSSITAVLTGSVLLTMDFVGHAQYFGEDLHVHCEQADLMLRHGELWIGRNGRRDRLEISEPETNPVSGFLDVILKGEANPSPPDAALAVYDMTQAILASSRTGASIKLCPE